MSKIFRHRKDQPNNQENTFLPLETVSDPKSLKVIYRFDDRISHGLMTSELIKHFVEQHKTKTNDTRIETRVMPNLRIDRAIGNKATIGFSVMNTSLDDKSDSVSYQVFETGDIWIHNDNLFSKPSQDMYELSFDAFRLQPKPELVGSSGYDLAQTALDGVVVAHSEFVSGMRGLGYELATNDKGQYSVNR